MKILRDHVLGEFIKPFIFTLIGLVFLFLLGRGVLQLADYVLNKSVDPLLIARLMLHSLPFMLVFIIPIAVLTATLICFGRLSHDNELMAMRAGGIGLYAVIRPLLMLVLAMSLFSYLLTDRIASTSHYSYRKLLKRIGVENPAAALEEGMFIKRFKNFVIFIYEIDKNKLKGIRIYQPQEGRPTRTIIAQKGELISIPESGIIKLKLIQGTSDEPDPKDPSKMYKLNFRTYDLPLNTDNLQESNAPGKKPKDMTVRELRDEIDRLGLAGIKATYPLSAEIHNKFAISMAGFVFLLIGVPLGITTRRSHRSVSYALSLGIMTLYWSILIAGKAVAQKGLAPPFWCLQTANLIMATIGVTLLARMAKN